MPTYSPVSWQPGELITHAKMQQMADNEAAVKEQADTIDAARKARVAVGIPVSTTVSASGKTAVSWGATPFSAAPAATATPVWKGSVGTFPAILYVVDVTTTGCNIVAVTAAGALLSSGPLDCHVTAVGPRAV